MCALPISLAVIGRQGGEFQLVERLVHRARRAQRSKIRHIGLELLGEHRVVHRRAERPGHQEDMVAVDQLVAGLHGARRSEEHTSELQSLMRISYAVFCLKKKKKTKYKKITTYI